VSPREAPQALAVLAAVLGVQRQVAVARVVRPAAVRVAVVA
jgi:hypothetical protein